MGRTKDMYKPPESGEGKDSSHEGLVKNPQGEGIQDQVREMNTPKSKVTSSDESFKNRKKDDSSEEVREGGGRKSRQEKNKETSEDSSSKPSDTKQSSQSNKAESPQAVAPKEVPGAAPEVKSSAQQPAEKAATKDQPAVAETARKDTPAASIGDAQPAKPNSTPSAESVGRKAEMPPESVNDSPKDSGAARAVSQSDAAQREAPRESQKDTQRESRADSQRESSKEFGSRLQSEVPKDTGSSSRKSDEPVARSSKEQDAPIRAESKQQSDVKDRSDVRQEPTGKLGTREGAEMRTSEQAGKSSDVSAIKPGDKDVGGKAPGRIDDVVMTQSLMPQDKGGRGPTDAHPGAGGGGGTDIRIGTGGDKSDKPRGPEGALGDTTAKSSRLVDIHTSQDSITFTLQTKDGQRKIDLADPKTQQSILDAAAMKEQGDIKGLQQKHPVIAEFLGTLKQDQLNQIKDTLTQANDMGPRNKAIDSAVVQDLSVLADRMRGQMKDQTDVKSRGELAEKSDATKDAKLEGKKDIKSETDGRLSDNVKQAFTKLDNVIDKIKSALHGKEEAQERINKRQASHLDYMRNLVEKYGGVPSEIVTPKVTIAEPGKLTDQHMDQIFDRLSKSTEKEEQKEDTDESTTAKKDDEDTHTTCTVNQGDTVRTIARDRLQDPNLAPLICQLNPATCKLESIDLYLPAGLTITLPNQSDIAHYKKQLQDQSGTKTLGS